MIKTIDLMQPAASQRVIDLVRDAGIDVSDWVNFDGGAGRAASNPKYCYEWSFCAPGRVVVVNIWHARIREESGKVTLEDNLRETANFYADVPSKAVWKKRSETFDRHIAHAAAEGIPVRTIICDGEMRAKFDLEARASRVKARLLDPAPWAVTLYDSSSGRFVLERGALANRLIDQFVADTLPGSPTEVRSVTGIVFVRNPAVRRTVMARANGLCEWCGELGFATDDGSVFLETHHVVPLSENGPDTVSNVVALCANHHREAHFGSSRMTMRKRLLDSLKTGKLRAPAA